MNTQMQKENRLLWIDAAKGIGMLAIVLGHVLRGEGLLSTAVYTFHVPLFFLISGFLYRPERGWRRNLSQSAKKLLIPYLFWGAVSIGIYGVLGRFAADALGESQDYTLYEQCIWLLYGYCFANAPLWFLPCLFVARLVLQACASGLQGTKDSPHWIRCLAALVPPALSALMLYVYFTKLRVLWPWSLQTVFCVLPFMWLGHLFRSVYAQHGLPEKGGWIPGLVLTLAGLLAGTFCNGKIQYMALNLGNWGLFYVAALSISAGLLLLCAAWGRNGLLTLVGRYSMPVLLLHKFPVLFFQCVCPGIRDWLKSGSVTAAAATTLVSTAMCILAGVVLNRLLPWTVGYAPRRQNQKGE